MALCKDCGLCAPTGKDWMCLNPKNKQGDFVMFVKPDDDHDKFLHCFEKRIGERKEQT